MKNRLSQLILLLLLISVSNFAQDLDKAKLDKFLDVLAEKNKAMGSLTIEKGGKVLYQRAIGYKQIDDQNRQPATAQTKYRIGSISKTFTAVLIFQYIEKGKLKLTDTIDKFFPSVPNAKKITVSNLLNHRSGLHNFTNDADFANWETEPQTKAEMLERFAKAKPDFEPNAKADYSNTNYVLLGFIIEKLSGKSYAEVLKSNITSKINLNDTYYGGKIDAGKNEAFSYTWKNVWDKTSETDMSVPGGAGAIVSTPTDLTIFADALFKGKLVSEKNLEQMKTSVEKYGMGLFQYPVHGKKAFGHSGGIDGFNSMLLYVPEEDLAISYISNGTVYPINDLLLGVTAIYWKIPFTIPNFETISVKTEDLDKYLGVYSSTAIPLKIIITKEDGKLFAQGTGQSAFPLEASEKDKFKFDTAGIIIEFNPEKNQMMLKQGGGSFLFTKEK